MRASSIYFHDEPLESLEGVDVRQILTKDQQICTCAIMWSTQLAVSAFVCLSVSFMDAFMPCGISTFVQCTKNLVILYVCQSKVAVLQVLYAWLSL